MRILAFFSLFALWSCHDEQPQAQVRLIQEERLPSESNDTFSGCSLPPDPMLAILSDYVLVDGAFVASDAELESTLNAKQELNSLLGNDPIHHIVIQVGAQVPEARVTRLLDRARNAGFTQVTRLRMADPDPPAPRTKPPRNRRPSPASPPPP